jgi:hypothetical protein
MQDTGGDRQAQGGRIRSIEFGRVVALSSYRYAVNPGEHIGGVGFRAVIEAGSGR